MLDDIFVFIYVLGSKISLPFVDLSKALRLNEGTTTGLQLSSAVMGKPPWDVDLSIGLSPWMSSMILWRMFTVSKRFNLEKTSTEIVERRKMYVTLALAIVQSLAVAMYLPLKTGLNPGLVIAVNTMIMVAGAFFLVWLSDLNAALGLGSSVVIMMAGMVMYLPEDVMQTLSNVNNIPEIAYVLGVIFILIFVYVAVLVEYSKYQIPVNKLGIHNNLKSYTFLDIKLNPAGGMPFMYAMTLVSIPQYAMLLILSMDSNAKWAARLAKHLVMGDPIWILLYILMIAPSLFCFCLCQCERRRNCR